MSKIIPSYTSPLPPSGLPRVRWNVEQFENLVTMGLLPEGGYELIEGDIVEKMPVKHPHSLVITRLFALFSRLFGFPLLLSQFSLWINNETLPEPDFAVLLSADPVLTERSYVRATEVRLLVEVSDATLQGDLTTKAALYAQTGIAEYWVIDITGRRLLIHLQPGPSGYGSVTEYDESDTAAPAGDSSATFSVREILP